MDRALIDAVVEKLRGGDSVALVADRDYLVRRATVEAIENELRELSRVVLWIDLEGAVSGAELGGRIVEGCMPELDHDELGDLIERLPARGRLDMEAFAELLMLPETVATGCGRPVVAILDGFENVERVIGMSGLSVVRDALLMRDQVSYLFVGSARIAGLFGRPQMPLYGLAEVVQGGGVGVDRQDGRRLGRPSGVAGSPRVEEPAPDPLAAALLGWAEAPPKPKEDETKLVIAREMPSAAELAWERFMARERRSRDLRWEVDGRDDEDDGDDEWWKYRRRGKPPR